MNEPCSTPDLQGLSALLRLGIEPDAAIDTPGSHPALAAAADRGYRVLTLVARGGFGEVWRAIHPSTQRDVVIKCISKQSRYDQDVLLEMLDEERSMLAELDDNRFPRLVESGGHGESLFIAMDYIDGDPIDQFNDLTQLDGPDRLDLVEQLIEAVSVLHAAGIAHGDLKPANVLMRDQTTPVIVDFGMAARYRRDQSRLIQPLHVGGTPSYMAPELVSKSATALRPEADVFSLCLLALEVVDSDPANSAVSAQVRRALGRGLAAEPANRTPDAIALLEDFRRARRYIAPYQRRPVQIAAASLFSLLSAAVWLNAANNPPTDEPGSQTPESHLLGALSEPLHHPTVRLLRGGDTAAARERLESIPQNMRGWEWDYLMEWSRAERPPIDDRPMGEPNTADASWSSDSSVLVYATTNQQVIAESRMGDTHDFAKGLGVRANFVAVDNSARHVLICTDQGELMHCRRQGSEMVTRSMPIELPVRRASLDDADDTLTAWVLTRQPATMQQLSWNDHYENWNVKQSRPCLDTVFGINPDYPVLMLDGQWESPRASLFNSDGEIELQMDLPDQFVPMSYAYDPQQKILYAGDYHGAVWQYQPESGWSVLIQIPAEQPVLSMDLDDESDRLFIASGDAYVVDPQAGSILLRLNDEDHTNIILKIRWNPATQTLHALTSDHARTWGQPRRMVSR